ncbi:zinc finger HIT domain-containing protein 1 isoform X2 [Hypanus sabinus]|uniref:zinc finger HIT domain-containing protein 1 isoform X2 n=1 Tax=Hypanus sabinus TaxID=79690 RepID=UPI0028C4C591|nr:zinc finger HIT domain-containing protein 1 isoform X2 [Hypanus sabinus]
MVEKKRESTGRSQDGGQRRVLDQATRQRRLNRQLDALEKDNFQDDPHANLPQLKRLPQFDDPHAESAKKKKKTRGDHFKQRFRKNFQSLLEEQNLSSTEGPNYLTACVGPSKLPQRHFCAVCGFPSNYTCVSCGARYCCVKCQGTHQETSCCICLQDHCYSNRFLRTKLQRYSTALLSYTGSNRVMIIWTRSAVCELKKCFRTLLPFGQEMTPIITYICYITARYGNTSPTKKSGFSPVSHG